MLFRSNPPTFFAAFRCTVHISLPLLVLRSVTCDVFGTVDLPPAAFFGTHPLFPHPNKFDNSIGNESHQRLFHWQHRMSVFCSLPLSLSACARASTTPILFLVWHLESHRTFFAFDKSVPSCSLKRDLSPYYAHGTWSALFSHARRPRSPSPWFPFSCSKIFCGSLPKY